MRVTPILSLALAGALAGPALAQTLDAASLTEIGDTDVVSPDGAEVGEVEDVLIDDSGAPVAVTVEISEGFLDIGDDDEVIFTMDELTFENGKYVTGMAAEEIEKLPRRED